MVAAAIGQVLESGIFACKESGERFIKVPTVVDFAKPLRSQLMATSNETGCFCVNLKYEYLPSFCYHCGRVGHARRDCTFAPPNRKERFGPHMSTKKLGRKIYEEEDESMRNRGPRQTVWVNRLINGPANNDRTYIRGREAERQGAVQKAEVIPQLDREESGPSSNPTGIQDERKVPNKKASPRGFAINKPARIQIGGRRLNRQGKLQEGDLVVDRNLSDDHTSGPPELHGCATGVLAQARRRRLILETDDEDDALDIDNANSPIQKERPQAGLKQNPAGEKASGQGLCPTNDCRPNQEGGRPAADSGPSQEIGAAPPLKRPTNRLQKLAHPVKKGNRRKAQTNVGDSSHRKGGPKRGSKAGSEQAKPVGCSALDGQALASVPSAEVVKALVSADSDFEEEAQCFEIKKRLPAHLKEPNTTTRGHVSQVVVAFEAGLTINSGAQAILQERMSNGSPIRNEQVMLQEFDSKLDEYGSNLMNPDIGTRKRPFEAVEGVMGDAPSPKKQFVEVAENLDQVEEASLKWPQSDK
ncbi:unnamed protein product [Linum trigynum]|uniref:CCHC-type domain-containing protein n=1 Tax=Linum trigynum TaxID=586398 RepID=A0AAV2GMP6_9ROSI